MKFSKLAVAELWLGILTDATYAAAEATTFTPARPPAIPLAGKLSARKREAYSQIS
jgi:hypothetical protein